MEEITTSVPEITAVDEPLLSPPHDTVSSPSSGDRASSRVPMLLRLFARRRGASMIVRRNVALQLEDDQEDWGYSLPVVVIETLWSLLFVVVSFGAVFWFAREEDLRLRIWICGYSVLCVINTVLLVVEYMKRNGIISSSAPTSPVSMSTPRSDSSFDDDADYLPPLGCELINTVMYYSWWAVGFGWMLDTYNDQSSPRLFWLTLAFLAVDVFFLALRVIVYIVLSAAICFCLPCIFVFMYYINRQERASEAVINSLPTYRFKVSNGDVEQPDVTACRMIPTGKNCQDFCTERVIPVEKADCCICLCHYKDGEQLLSLPCNHHFHSKCIVKWLRLKATCPVCKSRVAPDEQG